MTQLTEFERDRIILATARGVLRILEHMPNGMLSVEHVELIQALDSFPIITEEPRR